MPLRTTVTCSESAHVRRTLLAAVGSGGNTSRASLYFSCQCAGLDGNPAAICAVSRQINRTALVGVFFKRETAQIAAALGGQANRTMNPSPLSLRTLRSLWFPKVFSPLLSDRATECLTGEKLLKPAKRKLPATSQPAAKPSLCFFIPVGCSRLRCVVPQVRM